MPKKNGFKMFLQARRPSTANYVAGKEPMEVVGQCLKEWKILPKTEKARFIAAAKAYNEQEEAKQPSNPTTLVIKQGKVEVKAVVDPYQLTDVDLQLQEENRALVNSMFKTASWMSEPIVLCSFNLIFEPRQDSAFTPAEVGLTAMSLQDGVVDNFARIIDPGIVPIGYGVEASSKAANLGNPKLGTIPELMDHQRLVITVQNFLEKHKSPSLGKELHVFAFDSDFVKVSRCLDWLFQASGVQFPVKVMSLNMYAFLASAHSQGAQKLLEKGHSVCSVLSEKYPDVRKVASEYRQEGQSLVQGFIYNANYPTLRYGFFVDADDVEFCIKRMDNYKYYEELCCVYHINCWKEPFDCILNTTNRYAFSLLEILTLSNEIAVVAGRHFPEVDKPDSEKKRRYRMLQLWGVTQLEQKMVDAKSFAETEDTNHPVASRRGVGRGRRGFRGRMTTHGREGRPKAEGVVAPATTNYREGVIPDKAGSTSKNRGGNRKPFRQTGSRGRGKGGHSSGAVKERQRNVAEENVKIEAAQDAGKNGSGEDYGQGTYSVPIFFKGWGSRGK